jgi:glycosyltransferase involved in cell wall biosynthesis
VIGRLLAPIDPASYCLITQQPAVPDTEHSIDPLGAHCHHLPREAAAAHLTRPGALASTVVGNFIAAATLRAARIARIAKQERCNVIVGSTADIANLPAAFLAAKFASARFYAYLFDSYEYQWIRPIDRAVARRAARLIFPRAHGVIVPNEALRTEIATRYGGVDATVVPNPFHCLSAEAVRSEYSCDGTVTIAFFGAVYHVNAGAFCNLIAAMAMPGLERVKLCLYTAQTSEQLAAYGIVGERVEIHAHIPPSEAASLQQSADILFLPYAFDSPVPEIIQTSAPSKMSDYLAAARPILVHARSDALVCNYFRNHGCGMVVDQNQPAALAAAISELIAHPHVGAELATRARQRARAEFDPDNSRKQFLSLISDSMAGSSPAITESDS